MPLECNRGTGHEKLKLLRGQNRFTIMCCYYTQRGQTELPQYFYSTILLQFTVKAIHVPDHR